MQNLKITKIIGLLVLLSSHVIVLADDSTSIDPVQVIFNVEADGHVEQTIESIHQQAQIETTSEDTAIEETSLLAAAQLDCLIEDHLDEPKSTDWFLILVAIMVGAVVSFVVVKRMRKKDSSTS